MIANELAKNTHYWDGAIENFHPGGLASGDIVVYDDGDLRTIIYVTAWHSLCRVGANDFYFVEGYKRTYKGGRKILKGLKNGVHRLPDRRDMRLIGWFDVTPTLA